MLRAEKGTPPPSSPSARRRMQRQPSANTEPELAVRRELHRRGMRYRVGLRPIPDVRRTADIVFTRARVVIFVDGCFWHACPMHGTWPKANLQWWRAKLENNANRDHDTDLKLREAGWTVLRVWEHEDPADACNRIVETVQNAQREP